MLKKIYKKVLYAIHFFALRRGFHFAKQETFCFTDQEAFFKKKSPKVIFDLGANYGKIIGEYRKSFPDAAIYGFEPIEELYQQATGYFLKIPQVQLFRKAVTDYNGTIKFNINNSKDASSILDSNTDLITDNSKTVLETMQTLEVPCVKIDDFCNDNNIAQIDILKMDIQGGELKALQGAENMLKNGKISLIYTEVWFVKGYKDQPLLDDITAYLHKYAYKMFHLYNITFNVATGRLLYADAIFIHENFALENNIEFSLSD